MSVIALPLLPVGLIVKKMSFENCEKAKQYNKLIEAILKESEIKNKHSYEERGGFQYSESRYYDDIPTYYIGPCSVIPPIFPIYLSDDHARNEIENIEMEIYGYTLEIDLDSSKEPRQIQQNPTKETLKKKLEELKSKPLLFSNPQKVSDEIAQNLHRLNEKATILKKELNFDAAEIIQKVNEKIFVLEKELNSLDTQCKNAFRKTIQECNQLKVVCNELKVKHTTSYYGGSNGSSFPALIKSISECRAKNWKLHRENHGD